MDSQDLNKKCCLSHRGRHCDEGLVLLRFSVDLGIYTYFDHVSFNSAFGSLFLFAIWIMLVWAKAFGRADVDAEASDSEDEAGVQRVIRVWVQFSLLFFATNL